MVLQMNLHELLLKMFVKSVFCLCFQHHDIYCDQVVISPLSELPNRPIDQYIGNLNLFFIRETTAVKEVTHLLMRSSVPPFILLSIHPSILSLVHPFIPTSIRHPFVPLFVG